VAAALAVTVLAATYGPARRASGINPVKALRGE
jgi:ABC-type lipoprotein release transport system permease subunit